MAPAARPSLRPILALTLLAGLFTAQPAAAYVLKQDSTGAYVRWAKETRFIVDARLDQRLGADGAARAVERSIAAFAAERIKVSVHPGEVSGIGYDLENAESNRSEIVVPEVWEFDENALAVTVVTVNSRTHEILDADIALNAQHRRFGVVQDPEEGRAEGLDDVQNTLTHELGHALGLAHNPELVDVVMYPSASRGEIHKRDLSHDDREGLAHLYGLPGPAQEAPGVLGTGCSSAGLTPLAFASLGGLLLLRSRRRAPGTPT